MKIQRSLLRGAAALALASAIGGAAALTPSASAMPLDDTAAAGTVKATMNRPKVDNDNEVAEDGGGIGDVPIVGEVIGPLEGAEPGEIVTGAVQFAGFAAETVVPLIEGLVK